MVYLRSSESSNSKDRGRSLALHSRLNSELEMSGNKNPPHEPFFDLPRESMFKNASARPLQIAANLFKEPLSNVGLSPMKPTRNSNIEVKEEEAAASHNNNSKKPVLEPLSVSLSRLNPNISGSTQYQSRMEYRHFGNQHEVNYGGMNGQTGFQQRPLHHGHLGPENDLQRMYQYDLAAQHHFASNGPASQVGYSHQDSLFGAYGGNPPFFFSDTVQDRPYHGFRGLGQSPIKHEGSLGPDLILHTPQKKRSNQIRLSEGFPLDFDEDRDCFRPYQDEHPSRLFSAEKPPQQHQNHSLFNRGGFGQSTGTFNQVIYQQNTSQHEILRVKNGQLAQRGYDGNFEQKAYVPDHLAHTPQNTRETNGHHLGGGYTKRADTAEFDTTGTMKKRRIMHSSELVAMNQTTPSDQETRFGSKRMSRGYYGSHAVSMDPLNSTKKRLNLDDKSVQPQRNARLGTYGELQGYDFSNPMSSDHGSSTRVYTGANTRNRTKKLATEQAPQASELNSRAMGRNRKSAAKWSKRSEETEPAHQQLGNKGLKLLSHRVKEIVAQRRKTTYKEVAEILIHESKYISYINGDEDNDSHPHKANDRQNLSVVNLNSSLERSKTSKEECTMP